MAPNWHKARLIAYHADTVCCTTERVYYRSDTLQRLGSERNSTGVPVENSFSTGVTLARVTPRNKQG